MEAYRQDLAYIHDTGFTGFVSRAAPALRRALRRNGITGGLVVDMGCGSGVWARELTDAGYQVLGIDISPSMIRIARKHAPKAKFRVGSFLSTQLPPCDAVTAIGECVNYAFDETYGRTGVVRFFGRVFEALRPGGVLVFDIVEPSLVPGSGPQRRFVEGPDWAILLEVTEDRRRKTLARRIVSFRQVGKSYRRSEETHHLHLYQGAELEKQLTRVGFHVLSSGGYGRFRFTPAHVAFVAQKPA